MEAATLWIALVAACAAVASSIFAFVQARAATRAREDALAAQCLAESAQADAIRVAAEARDALGRSADALEAANLIAAKAVREVVSWKLLEVGDTRYRLVNSGRIVAYDVLIERVSGWVEADDTEPRDVGPGDSLFFNAMGSMNSETPRAKVRYVDRSDAQATELENILTLG